MIEQAVALGQLSSSVQQTALKWSGHGGGERGSSGMALVLSLLRLCAVQLSPGLPLSKV